MSTCVSVEANTERSVCGRDSAQTFLTTSIVVRVAPGRNLAEVPMAGVGRFRHIGHVRADALVDRLPEVDLRADVRLTTRPGDIVALADKGGHAAPAPALDGTARRGAPRAISIAPEA